MLCFVIFCVLCKGDLLVNGSLLFWKGLTL